ncbi:hypothetical protein [Pacificibacter marinus]|jgi:hypothetical protein|uniref:Uncharacterized protein n=1 Tax=Pacificibacter marinus TaxID=658057 RepID=A0A1Y5TTI9_9RHOB|nr:hypothetical protein [Pacificibacter marinus]SEL36525.1 hypothetical protein SAMN04488032_12012 [Pacificibacter marinus]SLN69338.1 hypothetical protein PAM7971_03704 [Pacificibacter marinus]
MSPPDTNLEKQKRRHRGPLIGMALVIAFVAAVIVYWNGDEVATASGAESAEEEATAADVREAAPTYSVEPSDPEIDVE